MAKKTKAQHQLLTKVDDIPQEIVSELESLDISPREFNLILAFLSAHSLQEIADISGYSYRSVKRKKKELAPIIEPLAAACRRKALAKAALLAPKAMNALDELLDSHKDSKSDTKRKVAESVLDRAVGRPPAKVSVEKKSTQRVQIVFPDWTPQAIEGETIGSEKDHQPARNVLAAPSGTSTKQPISEKEEKLESLQPRPGGSSAPQPETKSV